MRSPWLVTLLLVAVSARPAPAQHGVAVGARGGGECDLCHASHNAGEGSYTLRTGEGSLWFGRAGGDVLSTVSQSCLRCHGAPQVRLRQPDSQRIAVPGGTRSAYLGFDLSDDHPLGRAGQAFGRVAPAPGRTPRSRLTPRGRLDTEQRGIECSRCHDPHNPRGATPQPEDEPALCGGCHDLAGSQRGHERVPCSDCHELHGGSPQGLLREQGSDLACRACHDAAAGPLGRGRLAARLLAPQAHVRDARAVSGRCVDCHTVHQ